MRISIQSGSDFHTWQQVMSIGEPKATESTNATASTPRLADDDLAALESFQKVLNQYIAQQRAARGLSVGSTDGTSNSTNTASTEDIGVPEELVPYFEEAAATYGVDVRLLELIAKRESNFKTTALSSAGAMGIMQLMPATAEGLGVTDPYDARSNIMGGAKYIADKLKMYGGNVSLALAAYNAGSGNVAKYGGIPPFTETQNYVAWITERYMA
ncbi:MAG: transglycosylase SLT domain-containing protein [Lachnospiraceae bacterium]|nr:transglycosylase SLT domain-containing protein [Lachnospiraceae bacterium]